MLSNVVQALSCFIFFLLLFFVGLPRVGKEKGKQCKGKAELEGQSQNKQVLILPLISAPFFKAVPLFCDSGARSLLFLRHTIRVELL